MDGHGAAEQAREEHRAQRCGARRGVEQRQDELQHAERAKRWVGLPSLTEGTATQHAEPQAFRVTGRSRGATETGDFCKARATLL